MEQKIIRVFPRKTTATPTDDLAFVNCTPPFYAEADEVHISVAFTMRKCVELGFFPQAMLWKDQYGNENKEWRKFQRLWARPALIYARVKSNYA
jgi:hypothetical protein